MRGQLVAWDMAVSGIAFGYFLGWTARFLLSWRRAADLRLAPRGL